MHHALNSKVLHNLYPPGTLEVIESYLTGRSVTAGPVTTGPHPPLCRTLPRNLSAAVTANQIEYLEDSHREESQSHF